VGPPGGGYGEGEEQKITSVRRCVKKRTPANPSQKKSGIIQKGGSQQTERGMRNALGATSPIPTEGSSRDRERARGKKKKKRWGREGQNKQDQKKKERESSPGLGTGKILDSKPEEGPVGRSWKKGESLLSSIKARARESTLKGGALSGRCVIGGTDHFEVKRGGGRRESFKGETTLSKNKAFSYVLYSRGTYRWEKKRPRE